jgi:ABC-type multidrug transport system permease subunit
LARSFAEIPLSFVQSLVQMLVVYWTMGLNGSFFWYVLVVWLVCMTSASVATLVSSAVSRPEHAIQLSPVIYLPQILFSGLFVPIGTVPYWIRWFQYLSYLKYGINMLFIVEFGPDYPALANNNDIFVDQFNFYLYTVILIILASRILAVLTLNYRI